MTSFSANKNGIPQGGITPDVDTKITFPCADWDDGACYDTTTSRWTPPAGLYRISTHLGVDGTNVIAQRALHLWLYKNGVRFKALYIGRCVQSNASYYGQGSVVVEANGTDYFEIYMMCAGAGPLNNNGIARDHYWQGAPA